MAKHQETLADIFGPVIYSYTRAQALGDGVLVSLNEGEIAEVTRQHYKYPVAVTASIWDIIERAVANERHCNDLKGVIHDVLWMSRVFYKRLDEQTRLFKVKIKGAGRRSVFEFKAVCGPGDHAEPAVTIMLPNED